MQCVHGYRISKEISLLNIVDFNCLFELEKPKIQSEHNCFFQITEYICYFMESIRLTKLTACSFRLSYINLDETIA